MSRSDRPYLSCHALRVKQGGEHAVYLFALRTEQVAEIACIARLSRGDNGQLNGYQRGIAEEHVRNIADYLNSAVPLFPNAIIIALPSTVRFDERRGPHNDDGAAIAGHLSIPLPAAGEPKPGWIVDGQQRSIALERIGNRDFPVPIAAFIADGLDVQRDQFIRINSVKPLDKALVTELLPEVLVPISPRLSAKKIPSALVDQLNAHPDSPFRGLIRRPSLDADSRKQSVVQDTSLVNAIEESLTSAAGALFPYRNLATGDVDIESIWWILTTYWSAVRDTFPEAWAKPPTESRLMHGVGIRAMGRLMDRMMGSVGVNEPNADSSVRAALTLIAPHCHWTTGSWEGIGALPWNDLQNTPRHIRTLSNYLIRLYVHARNTA